MKIKNKIVVIASIAFLLVVPAFIGNALTPTERAQEQGAENFQLGGAGEKTRDSSSSVEEKGIVQCKIGECTFCDLLKMIERIFYWLLSIAFVVAVLFVIASGFLYILSVGDSSMMGMAKEGLKYSLIGFVICLTSWLAIHLVYTILGYKGDTWWKIDCDSQKTAQTTQQSIAPDAYLNEVTVDATGGRNNPIALPDFDKINWANLPENKYFFIHGLGGQPLPQAAEQLAALAKSAADNKKIVYAAVPYQDQRGDIIGSRLVDLGKFLSPASIKESLPDNIPEQLAGVTPGIDKETKDRFFDLVLYLLRNGTSQEIPLLTSSSGSELPGFNNIWPVLNWTGMEGDGDEPTFKALSSIISGLKYEEGNGPFFYDPERYSGVIPEDQTHVQINLTKDGNLNAKDPISVLNVTPGVSEEELETYLRQMIDVLFGLKKQADLTGVKQDFISGLTDVLTRSVNEKALRLASQKTGSSQSKKTSRSGDKTTKNNNSESTRDWTTNQNTNSALNNQDNLNTGGSGILPSQIRSNSGNKGLSQKEIGDMLKKLLKEREEKGGGGSGSGSGNGSGNGSNSGRSGNQGNGNTGNTGNTDNTGTSGNRNNNDNWSNTSVSTRGYTLNTEEKKQIEKMVNEYLQEMGLDVPPEFVLCIIQKESGFKPEVINNRGEYSVGLMQINKKTPAGGWTDAAALKSLKKYDQKLYQELLKQHGSDANITSTASMQSKNDPPGEKGKTILALGIAHLKGLTMTRNVGNLQTPDGWDRLAGYYNGAGPRSGYSNDVTACTKGMVAKRGSK